MLYSIKYFPFFSNLYSPIFHFFPDRPLAAPEHCRCSSLKSASSEILRVLLCHLLDCYSSVMFNSSESRPVEPHTHTLVTFRYLLISHAKLPCQQRFKYFQVNLQSLISDLPVISECGTKLLARTYSYVLLTVIVYLMATTHLHKPLY